MIHFACDQCAKKLRAPDHGAGKRIVCPRCRSELFIPPPVRQGIANSDPETPYVTSSEPSEDVSYSEPEVVKKSGSGCLLALAITFICVGLCLVFFYWAIYDTTVPVYPREMPPQFQEYVHNVGRMQNRTIGTVVGFGFVATGIALIFVHRTRR